jgi:twitching motility protein PilT
MSLVPSLLQAIITTNGEALVLHVGEKPYVVTPTDQVDLATRGLTYDAVNGIVNQLLPIESQRALDECGAVQYELPPMAEFRGEHFTFVAARGGEDVWAEIRRRKVPEEDRLPVELCAATQLETGREETAARAVDLDVADAGQLWPVGAPPPVPVVQRKPAPVVETPPGPTPAAFPPVAVALPPPVSAAAPVRREKIIEPAPLALPTPTPVPTPPSVVAAVPTPDVPRPLLVHPASSLAGQPTPVRPLARTPIRSDPPPPTLASDVPAGLDRLLRLAAARGASTLYLSSASRPLLRIDGDLQPLDGAAVLAANDVESLLLTLMPDRHAQSLRTNGASEWICDLPDVGRVRCMSFRDHRGPGGVFRMMPAKTATADHLGLSREVQALAIEPDGLVLVAAPRSGGKRTLMSAFVDLINRTRRDHVITIEREIDIVHERIGSLISQREVRGGTDDMLAAARAAVREDPDVLVLEELRTPGLVQVALDAAASGRLVIGCLPAHNATDAIDRIIELHPPESRRQVQLSLAQSLRGVAAQVLLRRIAGGRIAAREVLLNTPAVRSLLAEGTTAQLPSAIEAGRSDGMVPLNDALVGHVKSGLVDVREAYWRAPDRAAFLALMKRQGLDTSLIERPA